MDAHYKALAPSPFSGNINPQTVMLRPKVPLTEAQIAQARSMRKRNNQSDNEIAIAIGSDIQSTRECLMNMRTKHKRPERSSLNVRPDEADFFSNYGDPGDPMWLKMRKLREELEKYKK